MSVGTMLQRLHVVRSRIRSSIDSAVVASVRLRITSSIDSAPLQAASVLSIRTAAGLAGSGTASCFTCPYHGWQYSLQGRLVRASKLKGISNFRAAGEICPNSLLAPFDTHNCCRLSQPGVCLIDRMRRMDSWPAQIMDWCLLVWQSGVPLCSWHTAPSSPHWKPGWAGAGGPCCLGLVLPCIVLCTLTPTISSATGRCACPPPPPPPPAAGHNEVQSDRSASALRFQANFCRGPAGVHRQLPGWGLPRAAGASGPCCGH